MKMRNVFLRFPSSMQKVFILFHPEHYTEPRKRKAERERAKQMENRRKHEFPFHTNIPNVLVSLV